LEMANGSQLMSESIGGFPTTEEPISEG